ncbi:MAG: hypothetical protein MUC54_07645, partial [Chloroflexi bacterium]|nr:hypothetical protein [Chloroflexota bacterium]
MHEVRRRHDGELEGYVVADRDEWLALTVFHGVLARAARQEAAREVVHRRGLASLADRWFWYSRVADEWQVVVPLEATPGRVRVALGYYSLPGVETTTITSSDLDAGDRLSLAAPDVSATPPDPAR